MLGRRSKNRAPRVSGWPSPRSANTNRLCGREGAQIIRKARAEKRPMVLLLSRPYHIDPQIHHKAPDILTDFGVDVLTEDSVPLPDRTQIEK